jgi:hypothetical protein
MLMLPTPRRRRHFLWPSWHFFMYHSVPEGGPGFGLFEIICSTTMNVAFFKLSQACQASRIKSADGKKR